MSDTFAIILILSVMGSFVIIWFFAQSYYTRVFKRYLLETGWEIISLDIFRLPKVDLLKAIDRYIRKGGGQNALLMAKKVEDNHIFVTQVNAISTPGANVLTPILNLFRIIEAGLYTVNIFITNINQDVTGLNLDELKKNFEKDHSGTRVIAVKANLPSHWISLHKKILEFINQRR